MIQRSVMFFLALSVCFLSRSFADDKISVAVTILPLAEFVEQIGKANVEVITLIPAKAEPHSYEPTPQKIQEVAGAKLFVKVGTAIEFELYWLDKILSVHSSAVVCDSSKGIDLMPFPGPSNAHVPSDHDDPHYMDPHVWLSVNNAIRMVENITQSLKLIDPPHAGFYDRNAEDYKTRLAEFHQELKKDLFVYRGRSFMSVHPEWGYFAREYQLNQVSIEAEGKEPTAANLAKLVKRGHDDQIKIILTAPQFSHKSAEIVAREIGAKVVMADALSKNYMENIRKLTDELSDAWEESSR